MFIGTPVKFKNYRPLYCRRWRTCCTSGTVWFTGRYLRFNLELYGLLDDISGSGIISAAFSTMLQPYHLSRLWDKVQ